MSEILLNVVQTTHGPIVVNERKSISLLNIE